MSTSSFWQMLTDLGREHDRQLTGLLDLVRELRLELNRSTSHEEIVGLRNENLKLKKQLSLTIPKDYMLPDVTNTSSFASVQRNRQPSTHAPSVIPLDSNSKARLQADTDAWGSHGSNGAERTTSEPEPAPPVLEQVAVASSLNKPDGVSASESPRRDQSLQMLGLSSTQSLVLPEATGLDQYLGFVTAHWFETLVATLIMINTIIMMVEAQYLGLQAGYITGFPSMDVPIEESWPWAEQAFFITDRMFTAIFFLELMLRILRFRIEFFKVPLNWIDIVAVLASILQAFLEGDWMNPTVVRLLRVSRPVRSIRFLKNKQIQRSLNILMKCLVASLVTLFWSLCLLLMIQCMISMVAGQVAQDFVSDLNNPENGRHEVFRYYGTFSRCLVTMFEIHMANWAAPCRVVLNHIGESWGNALVFYRCVMGYALMSVLGAVFVQQAMSVQQQDQELMILRRQKETERYTKTLKALFGKIDTDGDGQLSRQEFDVVSQDHELKHWMESLDMNSDDLEGLFDMLDTGDGFVSFDEFLTGATRVRGHARNIDVAQLMVTVGRLEHMMEKKIEHLAKVADKFDALEELIRDKDKEKCGDPQRESTWRTVVNGSWASRSDA